MQSGTGTILRQLSTPNLQVKDFIVTPDQSKLVLAATIIRRSSTGSGVGKVKPAMSGRTVHDPLNGISGDPVIEFGYEEMDNVLVVVRREDNEVLE